MRKSSLTSLLYELCIYADPRLIMTIKNEGRAAFVLYFSHMFLMKLFSICSYQSAIISYNFNKYYFLLVFMAKFVHDATINHKEFRVTAVDKYFEFYLHFTLHDELHYLNAA